MDIRTEDRERRIAQRRERAMKRLQLNPSTTMADVGSQPTSCHSETIENDLEDKYLGDFKEIIGAFCRSIQEFKEQNEAFSSPPSEEDQLVVADLCHLLREAAAQLDDQPSALKESFFNLCSIKNPTLLRTELQLLTQQATSAERAAAEVEATAASLLKNKASYFVKLLERQADIVNKAIISIERESITAAAAMAEQASTTETALLQQLADGHETRRDAIAAEIDRVKLLEAALHEERVNKRQAQEKALEEMRKNEHAVHDALWHQFSIQATELALQLSLARHERLFTADKLGYNVRVLGERNKENKEVLAELQRDLHTQRASLTGLRSQYADEKDSILAAQEKYIKDAQHVNKSLNSLKDRALHFEVSDEEELRQLVALKEGRLSKLLQKLKYVQDEICHLCGSDSLMGCSDEIMLPPPPSSTGTMGVQIDEALKHAHWQEKLNRYIPQGFPQKLKRLEMAIRQDL